MIALLHLPDAIDVIGVEQLGAKKHPADPSLGADHRLDTIRHFTIPIGAREQELAGFSPRGSTADVGVIVRIQVDELQRIITAGLNFRHRDNQRLGPQVRSQLRVRRIGVRRLNRPIFWCIDPAFMVQLVPACLELVPTAIHEIRVHDAVVVHKGEAVDVCLFRNGPNFGR